MTRKLATPPRRPVGRGYARGEETRQRIVEAALDVFSAVGYEEASTRTIADRASVNLGALNYYFGCKEALYRACAEHIAEFASARLQPLVDRVNVALADKQLKREALLAVLRDMVDSMIEPLVGSSEPRSWVMFVIREQTNPTAAFDIIYERVMQRLITTCASIIGRVLDRPPTDPEVIIRTLALVGQLVFFRRMSEVALRALGWPDFNGDRLAKIKAAMHQQVADAFSPRRPLKKGPSARRSKL
jgi:TetR/AcrR family transcriptional regulator, regulator of cefoperazone and chloramphenicol sensitivity